jgi:hypothetical protein
VPWYPRNCSSCGTSLAARTDDPDINVVCMTCDPSPDIPLEPDGSDLAGYAPEDPMSFDQAGEGPFQPDGAPPFIASSAEPHPEPYPRHFYTGDNAPPYIYPQGHGSKLGRDHVSVRQHLIEDHDMTPERAAELSDGSVHGIHDRDHDRVWAYAFDLPHPLAAEPPSRVDRWFLKPRSGPEASTWTEVDQETWITARREAGFRFDTSDGPATGSWSGEEMEGRHTVHLAGCLQPLDLAHSACPIDGSVTPESDPAVSRTGLIPVAAYVISLALRDSPAGVHDQMQRLDNGQLRRLAKAASQVKMFAEDALAARPPGGYRPLHEIRHPRRCPDRGYCHHGCTTGCFRVMYAAPFAGYYLEEPDGQWPESIRAHYRETDGQL